MTAKLKEKFPEAVNITMPVELLSGQIYIEIEKQVIHKGKTKKEPIFMTLSKCPFCGKAYRSEADG